MTAPRNIPEKRHLNRTKHRRAMEEPEVRELVDILRQGWVAKGLPERGKQLCALSALGCSTRGLGREMKQSATSIRRHMKIAGLPEEDRKAIEAGASAKTILARKATADRQKRIQERVDEDQKTGALSDAAATIILEFCRTGKELRKDPIITRVFPNFLNRVAGLIRSFETSGRKAISVSKKLELPSLFRKTRPHATNGIPAHVHQREWLANILWAIAPESPIREIALRKAEHRASELTSTRTPSEMYQDRVRRLAELSASPVRPADKGAWSLKRQGGTSASADSK